MTDEFNIQRSLLFGIAYRMLGRVAEAEDMVQEAWLRWQKQDSSAVISSRAWLVATITRLCIDQLRSARRHKEEYYGVWLPEPLVDSLAPSPAQSVAMSESLSMAFMLMLETLSPVERAVILLRDVFEYEYADVASVVGKSESNCRQIARRAKEQLRSSKHLSPIERTPTEQAENIVKRFLTASVSADVDELISLLTADATLYSDGGKPGASVGRPLKSADHIGRFLVGIRRWQRGSAEFRFLSINKRPGALMIINGLIDRAVTCDVIGERIHSIYVVRNPEKLRHLAQRQPWSKN